MTFHRPSLGQGVGEVVDGALTIGDEAIQVPCDVVKEIEQALGVHTKRHPRQARLAHEFADVALGITPKKAETFTDYVAERPFIPGFGSKL